MDIIGTISNHVKVFLTVLSLLAMCIGIAGIWGYAGKETVGKAMGTMALIGGTVFLIDGVIYARRDNGNQPSSPSIATEQHLDS